MAATAIVSRPTFRPAPAAHSNARATVPTIKERNSARFTRYPDADYGLSYQESYHMPMLPDGEVPE